MVVVRIALERIISRRLNPKTNKTYVLDDVTNVEYRELYIREFGRNLDE